jgi:hypothetical protein
MVLGLIAGSVATAEAKGKKRPARVERTVEATYGPYPAPVTGCNEALGKFYCLALETRVSEAFLTAKVTDAHGQPVFVEVVSRQGNGYAFFCGETTEPIRVYPGDELHFYVARPLTRDLFDPDLDCPAHRVKTTGTISVTLSNLP